jgi:hypothetical protein
MYHLWEQIRPQTQRGLNVLVFLLYSALTAFMTWPIAGQLGTRIPASAGDAWVHLWTFRWLRDAIFSGYSPYYTDRLFFPDGVSLLFHNIAWVNFAAWLPLQALIGEGAAYSLVFMAVFAINGFATYLLALDVTRSKLAAFVAGLIVAFWPYALSHHNHPNLILIAWIPLALLYLRRFVKGGKKRDALFAALFIALIGFTRWQLLIMAGFIIGLYVAYAFIADKKSRGRRTALGLLAIGLLALLVMTPLLAPVVAGQLTRDDPEALFVDEELSRTDLLAYLAPSRYHPLWGDAAFNLYENFTVNKVFTPFLGYTVLILAIYGTIAAWPRSRFWLLAALLFILFALGPGLTINGRELPVPMPYALVADSFIVKLVRNPDRFNVLLSIPVAMLAAFGISVLRQRVSQTIIPGAKAAKPKFPAVLVALLAVLILGEYVVSYPTFKLETPQWYTELAQEPGEFGILDIPMSPRALPDKTYMFYQFVHDKAIVEGHVSRPPGEAYRFIDQVPLLAAMRETESSTPDAEIGSAVSGQLRMLSEANIRYLILHDRFLSDEKLATWKEWLIQQPLHEDDDVVVYRTDPELGRDFAFSNVLTVDPEGREEIGLIRASVTPTETTQGGSIQVETAWASASDVSRDYDVCLELVDRSEKPAQSQCRPLSPELPTSQWRANELVAAGYTVEISPYLASGAYSVTVALRDSDNGNPGDNSVAIGDLHFSALPRTFSKAEPSTAANITWDELIFLPGYDLSSPEAGENELAVTLYWQALDRMDHSYTAFLHLIDPDTGEIAAQADAIPRGWSYPTNWWEKGEVIEDTIRVPLEIVPAGEYALYVGWYDMATSERLPPFSGTGEAFADQVALLTNIRR